MSKLTEVLVIGAGPAGVRAASILAEKGQKVVIVGNALGGSYCDEGGVASNALLSFSAAYEKFKNINDLVQNKSENITPDFKRVQKHVESMENKARKLFADALDNDNITFREGTARFTSVNTAHITDKNGDEVDYKFKKCVIATGSSNKKLPVASGKKVLDSSSISSISSIPASVSIIGGGFIGIEIAAFFSRLGSKVNIVEEGERILSNVDINIVKRFEDSIKKRDFVIYTNKTMSKIERIGQKNLIFFDDTSIESEEVFVCVGRSPNTEMLELDNAGVEVADGVPLFDKYLRTSNENIFIAGDITDILRQSSWAYYSAEIAAKNILGEQIAYNLFSCPSILATDPTIALIGLSEEAAKNQGYDVGIIKKNCGDIFSFPYSSGAQTFIKAVFDKKRKTFLGAEAIGRDAKEVINIFAIVIQSGLSPLETKQVMYSSAIFNEFISDAWEKIK